MVEAIAIDTETFLIQPGLLAPPLVCVSFYDGKTPVLLSADDGCAMMHDILDSRTPTVWQNGAYDFGVLAAHDPSLLEKFFRVCDEDLVYDTKIGEQLMAIEAGTFKSSYDEEGNRVKSEYSLEAMARKYLGRKLDKGDDGWRKRYAALKDFPIDKWPARARLYAINDAVATWEVLQAQGRPVVDEPRQVRAAFATQLMAIWGNRTDPEAVKKLEAELKGDQVRLQEVLLRHRIIRSTGTKNLSLVRERIEAAYQGRALARTKKTNAISTSNEVLEESGDPILESLAELNAVEKQLKTFVPVVKRGAQKPINPEYEVLAETGRVRCRKPNMQNLPRDGRARECFIPRPGYVFCSVDYSALELCTLAQTCLDLGFESEMAKLLQNNIDPHSAMAARVLGRDYKEVHEKASKDKKSEEGQARQMSKAFNFGFPGGMGAEKMVISAKKGYGVIISVDQARQHKATWLAQFPEMWKYFDLMRSTLGPEVPTGEVDELGQPIHIRLGSFKLPYSNRIRGGATYTALCNYGFQGRAADGAKDALWAVTKECYLDESSPLFGARPAFFIHDEIIAELPADRASEAARRMAQIMREEMQKCCPDVPIKAEPALMRRWYKAADPVYVEGRLVPWEPKAKAA